MYKLDIPAPPTPNFDSNSLASDSIFTFDDDLCGPINKPPHTTASSSYCFHCSSCPGHCTLYVELLLPLPSGLPNLSQPVIRLIYLEPGHANDPLKCSLFAVSLAESPKFTALSYVWGDDTIRRPIIINGHAVSIADNLYTALIHLRRPLAFTTLWADAICIDQSNLKERNYQVEQMPKIYSAANEVIAWLGEASENSDLAMKYIADHARHKKTMAKHHGNLAPNTEDALDHLWSRPYWNRVWVVQELASAYRRGHRCIFRCGTKSVSFDMLRGFLEDFLDHVLFAESDAVLCPRRLITLSTSSSYMPFLEILWVSAPLKSSNPQDRIYGIRGISPQFYQDTIKVDYDLDFHDLYSSVMAYHIEEEHSLDILCYFHQFSSDSYPSWLCDLSHHNSGISPSTYSCSAGLRAVANIVDGVLYAKGIRISLVEKAIGTYQIAGPKAPEQILPQVCSRPSRLEELEKLAFAVLKARYPDRGEQFWEGSFMNMVAGDRQHQAKGSPRSKCHLTCRQLWDARIACERGLVPDDDEILEVNRYFCFIFERLFGRCLFTTSDGNVGLGPPDIQKDDVVCILYGCNLCAILRDAGSYYSFVGPAYLDSAMSGDYIRHLKDTDIAQSERFFSIR